MTISLAPQHGRAGWVLAVALALGPDRGVRAAEPEPPPEPRTDRRCPSGTDALHPPTAPCIDQIAGQIRVPPIRFDYDKAHLRPDGLTVVREVAALLAQTPELAQLEIQGHLMRDSGGYGRDLSALRARAVVAALVTFGIDAARLQAKGYGDNVPLFPARGPDARRNGRIELVIRAWRDAGP